MSLDFYLKTDVRHLNILFRLEDKQAMALKAEFHEFEKCTGVFIDIYRDTILVSDHAKLLSRLLSVSNPSLSAFLSDVAQKGNDIVLVGD